MNGLKTVHRITGVIIMIVLIYLSVTGLMMQSIDLSQIMRGEQPVDPDLAGAAPASGSSDILTAGDKAATALPTGLDIVAAIQSTVKAGRAAVGSPLLGFVDLRMQDGKLAGKVQTALLTASVDEPTGSLLHLEQVPQAQVVTDLDRFRYRIKEYHRMTIYGTWALWINVAVAVALFLMAVTGIWLYLKMWAARRKQGYKGLFWVGGGGTKIDWKRARHRTIGLAASLLLLVVAFSGEWLAYESLIRGIRVDRMMAQRAAQGQNRSGGANGQGANLPAASGGNVVGATAAAPNGQGSPGGPGGPGSGRNNQRLLNDSDLPALVNVTWNAAQKAVNGAPIKGIRIRAQGNNAQGVVITGNGGDTKQLVFNARTGAPLNTNPQNNSGFPWGMETHQLGKAIHRGSYFGVWARFLDLFAGAALLYLSINGLFLYIDFRKKLWTAKKKIAEAKLANAAI